MNSDHDDIAPLFEPTVIPDVYCTGLGKLEVLGPCKRLTFFVHQTTQDHGERAVVARLIIPADIVDEIAEMLLNKTVALGPTNTQADLIN